ncbi:MAG: hypothetical protein ACP5N7_00150 [Candidatus Pacearchaeota archaeon]
MKKLILFIMILFVQVSFAQTFEIKPRVEATEDSITFHWQQIIYHANLIGQLQNMTIDLTPIQNQINSVSDQLQGVDLRVSDVEDTLAAFRTLFNQILAGGVVEVPSPLPVTSLTATPVSTSQVNLSWTGAASVYDSIYLYRDGALIVRLDSGAVSYNNTGLSASTIYDYNARTVKYANGLALLSNYSNSDTAKTYDEEPPVIAPSGIWTYDYLVSPYGGGDTLTLSEALNLDGSLIGVGDYADTFYVAAGIYNITSGISFNAANTVWRGTIKAADEKTLDYSDATSTIFYSNSTSNGVVTISGEGVKLTKIGFSQNQLRELIRINASKVHLDSIITKMPITISSTNNHLIRFNGDKDSIKITNSWLSGSPRCAIWAEGGTSEASGTPDYLLIERCWFTRNSAHNAIQVMPYTTTDVDNHPRIKSPVIRYCTFEDNTYSDVIVFRNVDSAKVYGNLFIRSGKTSWDQYPTAPYAYDTSTVGFYCYNTVIGEAGNDIGVVGNQNMNGLVMKNNVFYNDANWYNGLIYRNTIYSVRPNQKRIDLRHIIDYNQYYQGSDPTGSSNLWYSLWSVGTSFTSTTYRWTTWRTAGYDLHSTNTVIPSFVDYEGGDYNVSTSNMSGNTDNIPADVRAYTFDGEVRESNSIGFNNKK